MKKVFGLLAAAAVLSSGVSFAQTQDSHDVEVKIPEVLRIRLVDAAAQPVTTPDAVLFDFVTDPTSFETDTLFAASTPADGSYNWNDVQVFSNHSDGWAVRISTGNDVFPDATAFDWSKVTVAATGANTEPAFDLVQAGNAGVIAGVDAKTGGWESLGFGPQNFSIEFDGSEDAGDYSTTVTYDIFSLAPQN